MRNTHFNASLSNAQGALRLTHSTGTMRTMKTGEKIRAIRLAKKMKLAEVENLAGIANGNLSRIERGEQWISEEKLHSLADALGVGVVDLFSEQFDANVTPATIGARAIPVISAIQAGALKEIADPYPPGAGLDIIYTDDELLSKWAFALNIEGDSMQPDFRPGDRVIIDPDLAPNPGDYVAAKNGEQEATFKKYRPRGMDASGNEVFELAPLNQDYPTLRSDTQHLIIIGVMVEHRKKYRRRQ